MKGQICDLNQNQETISYIVKNLELCEELRDQNNISNLFW